MVRVFAASVIGTLLGAGETQVTNTGSVTTIALALVGSGLVTFLVQKFFSRDQDKLDLSDKSMDIVTKALDNVATLERKVGELRSELDAAKAKLDEQEQQIAALRKRLETAVQDRARLQAEYDEALVIRKALQAQITTLRERISLLEPPAPG